MSDFLPMLLQAVIIAAVPVVTGAIIKGVQALIKYLGTKVKTDIAKKYLKEMEDAVTKAVTCVNQTYVDVLKKQENFTKENQEEALNKAVETATNMLTHEAIEFLQESYGELTELLKTYVEAEVRVQKQASVTV